MRPPTALRISFFEGFDTVAVTDGIDPKGVAIGSDIVFENGTLNPRILRAVHVGCARALVWRGR